MRRFVNAKFLAGLAVMAFVAAMILPAMQPAEWAASGHLQIPVRVLVFDAATQRPISDAELKMFHASTTSDNSKIPDVPHSDRVSYATTGPDGTALINYEFRTSASDKSPEMKAQLTSEWMSVSSEGYSSVLVPIGDDWRPTKRLRESGELKIHVGLSNASASTDSK